LNRVENSNEGGSIKTKFYNSKDFYAGLVFIFFGVSAVLLALSYPMGSLMEWGSGVFPIVLGIGLVLLGLIIVVRLIWVNSKAIEPWDFRPLLLVVGALLAFALLLQPFGVVLATLSLVTISCLGGREFRILEVGILYLVLVALVVFVFVYGTGIPVVALDGILLHQTINHMQFI